MKKIEYTEEKLFTTSPSFPSLALFSPSLSHSLPSLTRAREIPLAPRLDMSSLFPSLSFSLSLSSPVEEEEEKRERKSLATFPSNFSLVKPAVQVRPRHPLQRDDKGRGPQRQALLRGDPPDVLEGGRHGLVEPLRFCRCG